MTQDDIIKLAHEAGIEWQEHTGITGKRRVTTVGSQPMERIERFATLVAAAEREKCAKVCDGMEYPITAAYIRANYQPQQPKAAEPTDWSAA